MSAGALALLAAGIVAGELLEIRSERGPVLPLAHSVVLVVAVVATVPQFAATVAAAQVVAAFLRRQRTVASRATLLAQRLASAAAACAVYRVGVDVVSHGHTRWAVLGSLVLAGVAQIAVDEAVVAIRSRTTDVVLRAWAAELALVTSGVLMAIGADGIGHSGGMGLWGVLVFSVPLLATWYSFSRLGAIRHTYDQTIRALSLAPELGGFVRAGHAARVADLCVAMGRELGFDHDALRNVEIAARLHHLGHLCLDDPEVLGRPADPWEVAEAGAVILRATDYLAAAGDVLATEPLRHRRALEVLDEPGALGGHVLKVASAYDELTAGDASRSRAALEALHSGPGYVYDGRALDALERAVSRG
ncbi:MAG TPA: hypothetical protein VFL99_12580 [Segeticoccus sp.]|uniref:hypothetical protein n=1 Tax=Segeticoccus sp. TaxID=2706531 RepID=UPI002D7EB73F|nr:hypothetical protein [Segeticoccus sp.]HET8601157.1 hypothetical protein [Segeticoccus sp.]